ncbi:MAG: tRNA (N6-threonylcarbamoyladenosine(37)-N6)-methyltransferase TrmO [Candidatus Hodarchaeales archaeon]
MFEISPIGYVRKKEDDLYIEILPEFYLGLYRLESISHIFILWWIHENDNPEARQARVTLPRVRDPEIPPEKMGTFATRSPRRPNPIGMTLVKILKIIDRHIYIDSMDAFDGTPVLDIKPYLPNGDRVDAEIRLPPWFSHLQRSRPSKLEGHHMDELGK